MTSEELIICISRSIVSIQSAEGLTQKRGDRNAFSSSSRFRLRNLRIEIISRHTRTIGVTAPIVNHRSIRSRRAPRRHPSLTKCELAEGSSAAPRQLPAVVIYGARLAGLGEPRVPAREAWGRDRKLISGLEKRRRRRRRRRLLSPADALPRAASLGDESNFLRPLSARSTSLGDTTGRLKNASPRNRCVIGRNVTCMQFVK